MSLERWIRLIAGSLVTLSLVLAYLHSPYWLGLALFVGLNLAQSGLTRLCPAEALLRRLGVAGEPCAGAGGTRTVRATSGARRADGSSL
ncbi:MAG: DUF2892 domain-containing protein [Armatimonadota bacterium]|nr:DUF2892 domain-containing protein [Armatimonadota bacterium]